MILKIAVPHHPNVSGRVWKYFIVPGNKYLVESVITEHELGAQRRNFNNFNVTRLAKHFAYDDGFT